MNKEEYLNSNKTNTNLPYQCTRIRLDNRLLTVENIIYYSCRVTSAKIIKIENNNNVTIQFYAQGYSIYRFDVDSLLLESFSPYQINRQLY